MEKLPITKFTRPFSGKLFPENFGTVRLHDPSKYYNDCIHKIVMDGEELGTAKIYAVRPFEFRMIRDPLSWLDANLPANAYGAMLKRIYNNDVAGGVQNETVFDHIVFHWDIRIFEAHTRLLNAHYQYILDEKRFIDQESR